MIELAWASLAGQEPLAFAVGWTHPTRTGRPRRRPVPRRLCGTGSGQIALLRGAGENRRNHIVLAGARQPIPNGEIALVKLKIVTNAPVGSTRVRVERGLAYPRT